MCTCETTEEFLARGKRYAQALDAGEPFAAYAAELLTYGLDGMYGENSSQILCVIAESFEQHFTSKGVAIEDVCNGCLIANHIFGVKKGKAKKQFHDLLDIALA
jgi:hypothetical protein